MNNIVWSHNQTQDYYKSLEDTEKFNTLVDRGYDQEMLKDADLDAVIDSDDYMLKEDLEIFEENIAPKIAAQTRDGIVIVVTKDGGGKACLAEDILEAFPSFDIKLVNEDGNLLLAGYNHDNPTGEMATIYAIPEDDDKYREFIKTCLSDMVELYDYIDSDNYDGMIDAIIEDKPTVDDINNYCKFSLVSNVCEPIKADNLHESVEDVDLTEAKSKNTIDLEMELDRLKNDLEEFGTDGFYAISFKAFERDFPEFTKTVIKTFLKEMEILTKSEMEDTDTIDEYWRSGDLIVKDDWPCLLEGAKNLADGKPVQWEKLYKKYYKDYLK